MGKRSSPRLALGVAAAGAAVAGAYEIFANRWQATAEERRRPMPLDEVVRKPQYVTNRAITIQAPPEAIWPWLAQMGELPRGGFYSYEWIERLMGMKVKNAEEILPDLQNLRPGDVLDRAGTMVVKAVEPGRFVVLGPQGKAAWRSPGRWRSIRSTSGRRGWSRGSAPGSRSRRAHSSGVLCSTPASSSWSARCSWRSSGGPSRPRR
jgi:hypothetical protein